jgi:Lipid A core - O-antigen ligase and related enzymes
MSLPRSSRRRTSAPGAADTRSEPSGGLSAEDVPWVGLVGGLLLLLLAEAPVVPTRLQAPLAVCGTILLLLVIAFGRGLVESARTALTRGPALPFLLMALWGGASLFLAPFRGHAAADLLRVVAGGAAFLIAGYMLPLTRQLSRVLTALILIGIGIALYDLWEIGQVERGIRRVISDSVFGTHENVGSLLALLLPFTLAFAVSPETDEKPRLAAQGASLILGFALLVARTRSAWIGTVVAVVVLCILFARYAAAREGAAKPRVKANPLMRLLNSPVFLILAGFALLIAVGGVAPFVIGRASTLGNMLEDGSFTDRVLKWEGAARMAREKPLTGWGLGTYLVMQGRWTHQGDDVSEVLTLGTGHQNIAHNYYVQWAADTGAVGLALHLAVLATFLVVAVRGLRQRGSGGSGSGRGAFRRTLLIGSIGSVTAVVVDALASPAYNFHGIWAVFCTAMGLGIAALRVERRRGVADGPALAEPTPVVAWALTGVTALLAVGLVLGWGERQQRLGETLPRGELVVTATPDTWQVRPGTTVIWRAKFKDEQGQPVDTWPGTLWEVTAEPDVLRNAPAAIMRLDGKRVEHTGTSGVRITLPATNSPVTVIATFRDRYGREYRYASTMAVRADAPE